MTTTKELQEKARREFDVRFPDTTHTSCANKGIPCGTMKEDIKSFIDTLIAEAVEAGRKEERKRLIGVLEGMKAVCKSEKMENDCWTREYNRVLQKAIDEIKKPL